jgi:hypothetical protein
LPDALFECGVLGGDALWRVTDLAHGGVAFVEAGLGVS